MGGSFSAQAADLHSVWGLKRVVHHLWDLGELQIVGGGFPTWRVQTSDPNRQHWPSSEKM